MKTFMDIPFQKPPKDPTWMRKLKTGKKLDPIENEEAHMFKY